MKVVKTSLALAFGDVTAIVMRTIKNAATCKQTNTVSTIASFLAPQTLTAVNIEPSKMLNSAVYQFLISKSGLCS